MPTSLLDRIIATMASVAILRGQRVVVTITSRKG